MTDIKKQVYNKLLDSNVMLSQEDGKDFLIFEDWDEVKEIESFIKAIDEDVSLDSIMDYNWGFSDEYTLCSNCGTVLRTSPDSYGWQPDYDQTDYGIFCSDCIDEDQYIEDRINQNKLVNKYLVSLEDHGWIMLDFKFDNGMHYGMNSDPKKIINILTNLDLPIDVIFTGQPSQFYIDFQAWVNVEDVDRATKLLTDNNTDLPYDQATEMGKALKGQHSDHIKMETYEISQEDFIAGNYPK